MSSDENRALIRGLKFAVTPRQLPIHDIVTATEEACAQVKDQKVSQSLRNEVVKALRTAHPV